tara:strand:+ start:209 stop:802 length:594 start_codon:yes stop_codon:yes gene_type:complete
MSFLQKGPGYFNTDTVIIFMVGLVIISIFYINTTNAKFIKLNNEINADRHVLEHKVSTLINLTPTVHIDPKHTPPLRKMDSGMHLPGIPINIRTRGEPTGYQQVGVLVDPSVSDNPKLLPLYGQETFPGSRQWNYYTASDGFQSVKLAVTISNKDCQEHYGCKEIYDGDAVGVTGHNQTFKVNMYKMEVPRYIPHIV